MKAQDLLPGWESELVLLHYVRSDPPTTTSDSFLRIMRQDLDVVK
jgi:hypothetical protein